MRNLAQLDGNISLSDSKDDTFRDLYRPLIVDTAASPPPAAPEGPEGDVFQNSLQRLLDGIRAGPTLQSSTALDPDQGSDHSKDDLITLTPRPNLGDVPSNQQSTRDDELYGISPSAYLYAVQEPCVFLDKIINISRSTIIMDKEAKVVRAALICSTHLDMWPAPEFCSGDMATAILKTKKHSEIYVKSL